MFIDSHAHLTCDKLYPEVDELLARAQEGGAEAIINICTDESSLERGLELAKRYPWVYNVGSTTPHDVATLGEKEWGLFEAAARSGSLVAIGETGLDYYYDHAPRALQQEFLKRYFELALELNLPVVIHCRDAFDDLFKIADMGYDSERLLLHCFTGTPEEARQALDRGWTISFSGIVTFKRSSELREAAALVPPERMLVETDSPYLAPQSKRGKVCEPAFALETLECLAGIKGMSGAELGRITGDNARRFFGLYPGENVS